MYTTASVLGFSSLVAAMALAGGLLPLLRKWGERSIYLLFGFSAGVLLGAALLDLVPEAFASIGAKAGIYVLAGLVFLFLVEKFVMVHACATLRCEYHPLGLLALVGLSLHNLTDGLALGAGAMVPALTFTVFFAIFIHNGPTGIAFTGLLMSHQYPRRAIILRSLICFLMIPIGAVVSFMVLRAFPGQLLGIALAFSGGTFLYISLSDLLPEIHSHFQGRSRSLLGMVAGLFIIWLANILI